jgi:hypothetical protein
MPSDPLVSYYLELTITGNSVKGYSITGYKDGNRLKASVTGYFTTPSDLYIRETGSLDGPNTMIQTYCYFSAHLKLTVMMNGTKRWNGAFESHQANGTACIGSGGVMTVTDNAPPLDVPKAKPIVVKVDVPKPPVQRPIDTPKPAPKPVVSLPTPPVVVAKPKDTIPPKPVTIIRQTPPPAPAAPPPAPDSCQRTYDWNSSEFAFDIWDGWTIDGDVVSLSMNGNKFLEHSKLSEKKARFSAPLAKGLNVLYIYLHEEGFDPPNTPNLTLYDGSKTYELSVSGEPGEVARICIWRK